MRYLLDTCVLAELRRPQGYPSVRQAVATVPEENLFISVMTLGEIKKGIALLPRGKKKEGLGMWLAGLDQWFPQRVLPVDAETALVWGDILARTQRNGITVPAVDGLIAATALRHGLLVMTRNTRHFAATGVGVMDPWAA